MPKLILNLDDDTNAVVEIYSLLKKVNKHQAVVNMITAFRDMYYTEMCNDLKVMNNRNTKY